MTHPFFYFSTGDLVLGFFFFFSLYGFLPINSDPVFLSFSVLFLLTNYSIELKAFKKKICGINFHIPWVLYLKLVEESVYLSVLCEFLPRA